MSRRKYPQQPDSLDPADWWMYCDLLQDAGAPAARWRRAKRIGDSLHQEPRLHLLAANASTVPRLVDEPRHLDTFSGCHYLWVNDIHVYEVEPRYVWGDRQAWIEGVLQGNSWCFPAGDGLAVLFFRRCVQDWGIEQVRKDFFDAHGRVYLPFDYQRRKFYNAAELAELRRW